ncbi:MAG: tyrosine-type recombinase/integrase [Sphingomonadaceae bacterium]|nr:tyrosine-type recombinase/integrase [Sphingomonadaceae bacterium]
MATKLTDAKLKGLKPPSAGQSEISDTDVPGLRVRIGTTGAKTFIIRKRVAGKIRNITVGRYGPRFGLADARRKARSLLSDIEAGKAPPAPKGKGSVSSLTIRAMMPQYLESKAGLRSYSEVERILRSYVLPTLGDRLADTVTRGDVTQLLDQLQADGSPSRARAVHAQLSAFYSWALPRLDRLPANPCRDAGKPAKPKARDRVLGDDELAALWRVADAESAPWGPALKILMLTGARRDEVFSADHSEFDLDAQEWSIPAERSKNGLPHLVPLSDVVLAVVAGVAEVEGSGKLFPARGNMEKGVSGYSKGIRRIRSALDKALDRKTGPHWQMHDIRRTVATGMQRIGVRFEVTEAVLNHLSGARSGIAGVYQRHDWKAEKRDALDAWSRHLLAIVAKADRSNVIDLELVG